MAASLGYDGIELRFVQGEDSLMETAGFSRQRDSHRRTRALADCGLSFLAWIQVAVFILPMLRSEINGWKRASGCPILLRRWEHLACGFLAIRFSPEWTVIRRAAGSRKVLVNWRRLHRAKELKSGWKVTGTLPARLKPLRFSSNLVRHKQVCSGTRPIVLSKRRRRQRKGAVKSRFGNPPRTY